MHLQELKIKSPAELLAYAEDLEIENASNLRKQDMIPCVMPMRLISTHRRLVVSLTLRQQAV